MANVRSDHPFVRATVQDKIRGTIIGSALGDCIGLYTGEQQNKNSPCFESHPALIEVLEFLSQQVARNAYPDGRFQLVDPATKFRNDGHRNKFQPKAWTDDTDHALLIILSYLHHDGQPVSRQDVAERLKIWVIQGLRVLDRPPFGLGNTVGAVVLDKNYLADPVLVAHQHWVKSNRTIAPNGSLMRTHPLGIICVEATLDEIFQIATDLSIITHADPRCVVACCISCGLIRGMLRGEILTEEHVDTLLDKAYLWVNQWVKNGRPGSRRNDNDALNTNTMDVQSEQAPEQTETELLDREEFNSHIFATSFTDLQLDHATKIGYVYKCLGAAILSLRLAMRQAPHGDVSTNLDNPRVAKSAVFENIITQITYEAGDADTNACAAGALLGCWLGYDSLPAHWRDGMQYRDWLMQKCNGLIQIFENGDTHPTLGYRGSTDPDTLPDGGKGLMNEKELERRDNAIMVEYMLRHHEGVADEKKKPERKSWIRPFWTK
ncbi:hypothetical protein FQN57_000924 [Myotisia sp. PD_48]|nr:hypothetical protein FQN57_000924 [Myotisia sp. PD_48]